MSTRDEVVARLAQLRATSSRGFLDQGTRETMQQALTELTELPREDDRFLLDLLESTCTKARDASDETMGCAAIAIAVGRRGQRDVIPVLCRILTDPLLAAVHEDVVDILGRLGDPAAVPYLRRALADPEPWVRAKAASALGTFGARDAVPDLIQLLPDASPSVREAAVESLAELDDPRVRPALVRALETDEDPSIRIAAAEALGTLGGEMATAALHKAVAEDDDGEVVETVRQILGGR